MLNSGDDELRSQELHAQIQYRLIEELSASERRYRELVESVREVVFQCDRSGNITFLNRAWSEILGYPVDESLGRPLADFLLAEDREEGRAMLTGSPGEENAHTGRELRFWRKDGSLMWLMLSVRTGDGDGRVGSLYNIDERKRAEEALQEAHDRLEVRVEERTAELSESNKKLASEIEERTRAQEELREAFSKLKQAQADLLKAERLAVVGETSGRVAHEVLNPITSVFSRVEHNLAQWDEFGETLTSAMEVVEDWGNEYRSGTFAQYLATQNDDGSSYGDEDFNLLAGILQNTMEFRGRREEDLRFINKQLQRVIKIINTLRESVRTQRSVTRVKIVGPVTEAQEVLEDSLKKRRIELRTAIPADLPDVMADESEMIQVFTNLYRNAMQSIEEKRQGGGRLDTVVAVNDGRIEVRLSDTGTGIAEKVRDSIFNFDFSTKGRDQGTGLGLGISRRFVRECGGDLVLEESAVGVGSTFLITIPVLRDTDNRE